MSYYPVLIDLTGKKTLVVGGGNVALRKTETLLDFGAEVTVVSPEVVDGVCKLALSGRITLKKRRYVEDDVEDAAIVIAATGDRQVNLMISSNARARNIPVNVVDDPELCTFIVPAVVRRGDVTIAISTAGQSPALARHIREQIEQVIGPEYGEFTELLGKIRQAAKERIPDQIEREKCFRQIIDSDVFDMICTGRSDLAWEKAVEILERAASGGLK